MVDWAIANGYACYDCGERRCICEDLEADYWAEQRKIHRTNRLLLAVDLAERKVVALEDENENHPRLPECRERVNNLTRALLNNRRSAFTEAF